MNEKPLPKDPSLAFDRKQAQGLLRDVRTGDRAAIARFRERHPRFGENSAESAEQAWSLADAQLVVAREYGFASWPRWKAFVESRKWSVEQRADELVRAVCSADMRQARTLLAAEPELARASFPAALVCGETDVVERALTEDTSRARQSTGPNGWEPLVYVCFSRFLRADARRADGIVRSAKLLLAHGADPNAHYFEGEGEHRHLQACLYGAAGIANDARLTRALIDAGAELVPDDGESVYHAAEFADTRCLRLPVRNQAFPTPPAHLLR